MSDMKLINYGRFICNSYSVCSSVSSALEFGKEGSFVFGWSLFVVLIFEVRCKLVTGSRVDDALVDGHTFSVEVFLNERISRASSIDVGLFGTSSNAMVALSEAGEDCFEIIKAISGSLEVSGVFIVLFAGEFFSLMFHFLTFILRLFLLLFRLHQLQMSFHSSENLTLFSSFLDERADVEIFIELVVTVVTVVTAMVTAMFVVTFGVLSLHEFLALFSGQTFAFSGGFSFSLTSLACSNLNKLGEFPVSSEGFGSEEESGSSNRDLVHLLGFVFLIYDFNLGWLIC